MYREFSFVSYEIVRPIAKAFMIAIEEKDQETFNLINGQLNSYCHKAVASGNMKMLESLTALYCNYYEKSLYCLSTSINYSDINRLCSFSSVRGLLNIWRFASYSGLRLEVASDGHKEKVVKLLVNRFSALINIAFRYKDIRHIDFILNDASQISASFDNRHYELTSRLSYLRYRLKQGEVVVNEIEELKAEIEKSDSASRSVRCLFKATLFWAYFLYDINFLDLKSAIEINGFFKSYEDYIGHRLFEDILFLQSSRSEVEYNWSDWDFQERLEGRVYSPPSLTEWVSLGASVYFVKNLSNLISALEYIDADSIDSFEYLIKNVRKNSSELELKDLQKWGDVLNIYSEEELSKRVASVNLKLDEYLTTVSVEKQRIISSAPLSNSKVDSFERLIVSSWRSASFIHWLFGEYNNYQLSEKSKKDLVIVGYQDAFLPGFKRFLVDDSYSNDSIFGLDDFGIRIANDQELLFCSILAKKEVEECDSLVLALDKAFLNISDKGFVPNTIFIGQSLYSDFLKIADEIKVVDNSATSQTRYIGRYKSVNVFLIKSGQMSRSLVVLDFSRACRMYFFSERPFQDILSVSIASLDRKMAVDIAMSRQILAESDIDEKTILAFQNGVILNGFMELNYQLVELNALSVFVLDI